MTQLQGIQEIYELSPLQQGMLFHTLYTPKSSVYNLQLEFALEGALEESALEEAWRSLVARYGPLRSSFVWERVEKPYQVVHRHADLKIKRHDWCTLGAAEQGERRQAVLKEDRADLFDLARPPLMRLTLIVLAERKYLLVWTFHHIILEGWSAAIILNEFWKLYGELRSGRSPELPPVQSYGEYIRWLGKQDQAKAEAYWRTTLKGLGAATRLPIDRSPTRAPAAVRQVGACSLTLSNDFTNTLQHLARTLRVTLNTIIQGAWSILLSRYSGEVDVVFGAVSSGRPAELPGVESIVGMFVNTLPARVIVNPDERLTPWLQELQLAQATMRQYEFSSLMQVHGWSDVPPGQPLFHTALAFQNWLGEIPLGQTTLDLQVTHLQAHETSDQPLTLFVGMRGTTTLTLVYDIERFDRTAVERLLTHYRILMEGMAAHPQTKLRDLPLLTEAEQQQLVEWNNTAAVYPIDGLLHELIEAEVERTPERTAVRIGATVLSHAELERHANRLAQVLRSRGIGRGQRVGLCVERGADMLAAVLGILKAGGAYLPLDPTFPEERLRFMAEDAQLALLISTTSLAGAFGLPRERQLLLDADANAIASAPDSRLPIDAQTAQPGDPAYVIYTSGSTGKPKGVVVPHRAVVNFLTSMAREPGLSANDVLVAVTTLSFDIAVLELLLPLTVGATVVIATRDAVVDGRALRDLLEKGRATVMQATPATWRLLLVAGWSGGTTFKALVGGEALPKDLADQLIARGVELWNMYGPTETTVWSTCARITDTAKGITIGKPIANTVIRILDAQGNLCPVGVPGELCIGGDGVTLGYWNRPDLTAERFIQDPFSANRAATLYRTGDRARWHDDGTLEHLGRLDFQVKLRGYRIELGEIEAGIAQHPAVREVVVIAREDVPGDKRLVAYLVTENPPADLVDQLRALIRTTMPEYMVPAHFVSVDALPLTPSGKVDRKSLPKPGVADRAFGGSSYVAPRNDLEIALAAAWERVLGAQRVGINDNFFELGGNSLSVVKLIYEMEQATGFEIDLGEVFQSPTIAELVTSLGPDATKNASVVVPLQPQGDGVPIFCLCGIVLYKEFAESLGKDQPVFGVYVEEEQAIVNQIIRNETPVVSIDKLVDAYYKAIARFRPQGPYRLAGLSFGGILALELASKLRARGDQVDFVFLLDTMLPQGIRRNWIGWISRHALDILTGRGWAALYRLYTRIRNRSEGRPPEPGARKRVMYVDESFALRQGAAYFNASKQWKGSKFVCDFPVVLFRGSDRSSWGQQTVFDEDYGWRRYLGDRLSIVNLTGDHLSIVRPPNVVELGRKAQQYLSPESGR